MHPADGRMSFAEISAKMNEVLGAVPGSQLHRWQLCAFDTTSALLTLYTTNIHSIAKIDCVKAAMTMFRVGIGNIVQVAI